MIEEIREHRDGAKESSFAGSVIFQDRGTGPTREKVAPEENRSERDHLTEPGRQNDDDIRYLVDHSLEAFWQMDKDLKFTFTNPACEKISRGFKNEEFIGRSLLEFLTPEGIEYLRNQNGSRLENEAQGIKTDLLFYELQMRRKDGTYFWAGISSCPRRNPKGDVIGYQGIMRDIDHYKKYEEDRKKLEALLGEKEKMVAAGELAGPVAHELNNVMAGMIGHSELLMLKDDLDDKTFQMHVAKIIHSGERAAAVIQDFMIMSRRGRAVYKPVQLNELIPACMNKSEFKKISEQCPGIALNLDLEPSLHPVCGASAQLDKTITNLLSLSCEQAGPGGAVGISTRTVYLGRPVNGYDHLREGEYVVLSVTDSGAGITDEDIDHIFEPFYLRKAMKRGVTGLELSVARAVIQDHNGFIDVVSRIGCGATFTVYLPVSPDRQLEKGTGPAGEIHTDGPTSIN